MVFPREIQSASFDTALAILFSNSIQVGIKRPKSRSCGTKEPRITPEEYLSRCDILASHPDDPDRYAAGVPDEALAPGAVIESCVRAVESFPSMARVHFQLGRAYHVTKRHDQAVMAFVEAAD